MMSARSLPETLRLPIAALLLLSVCAPPDAGDATYDEERTVHGDTTFVHIRSGSVWGAPARLVEELRIGELEGRDEYMFGNIIELSPDGEGGVYVFDGQLPALRHYDATGTYTRTLGGRGGGPGEYQDLVLGLAVRRDGSVLLRDPRNARINIYGPDGEAIGHWPVAANLLIARAMFMDTAENIYLKTLLEPPRPDRPVRIGLLHLDRQGELVDTIPDPHIPGEPSGAAGVFVPSKVWDWSPFGHYVVGVNDSYSFELRHPDGRVTKVSRDYASVPVRPEERSEWEARNAWLRERQERQDHVILAEIPPVPSVKPAYVSLFVGEGGRIWVRRNVPSVKLEPSEVPERGEGEPPPLTWRAPVVFDVFEPDGTYLGEVRPPEGTTIRHFGVSRIWTVQTGELDEQYVVAYRLQS